MATLSPKPTNDMEVNRVEDIDHLDDEKKQARRGSDASSINEAALGDDLPPGYFYSPRFIGTMTVSPLHDYEGMCS